METANEEAAVLGEEITSYYVRCARTELYVSFFPEDTSYHGNSD